MKHLAKIWKYAGFALIAWLVIPLGWMAFKFVGGLWQTMLLGVAT